MNNLNFRSVLKIFSPPLVPEGMGAQVMRIIGGKYIKDLNPFLMLDYFDSKLPAGFPDHPHRGFETVSYLLSGTFYHEDFKGNKGILNTGDLQWMTAGKGILHAEIPGSFEENSRGFQLWINLQKKFKMCDPQYQEIAKKNIPIIKKDGVSVKLMAGEAFGQKGPIYTRTPAIYLDITLDPGQTYQQKIPKGWNGLCFVYEGSAQFGEKQDTLANQNQVVHLDINDVNEVLQVKTIKGVSFILIAGEPINEPIVQYGPFVMNTKEEIQQTFKDYEQGKNGFEGAQEWESKIKNMMKKQ